MSDELADDGIAATRGERLDRRADVAEPVARHALGDRCVERGARRDDEIASGLADDTDGDRTGGVAAIAVLEAGEVDPDDVALAEHGALARDTVDHDLVDRGAEHGWKRRTSTLPVAEERGARLGPRELAPGDALELGGGHAGDARHFDRVEDARDDPAGFLHFLELEGVLDDDAHKFVLTPGPRGWGVPALLCVR